jgi:predicted dehydrogenase
MYQKSKYKNSQNISNPSLWKIRKVFRYLNIYGVIRTFIKMMGARHMKTKEEFDGARWANLDCKPDSSNRNVAIIGCGNFAFSNIAFFCKEYNTNFLRYAYDMESSRSLSLCKYYKGAFVVREWREILADPYVRIVFIASNHASHAEYAIECIEAGKHVHIEKPHAVTLEQLYRMLDAMRLHPDVKVFLGFNRPRSLLFNKLMSHVKLESGSLMINWFVAGHPIPDEHWYYAEEEGGRVLGNLFHWTDLTLHLVGLERAFPCKIIPSQLSEKKSDFVLTIVFADQSCAAITFSAKGETFEGVREMLNMQRGNLIATLTDFQSLVMDVAEKKHVIRLNHRDHGHRANILHSLEGVNQTNVSGEDILYVSATARFVMAAREAIESGNTVELSLDDVASHTK